MKFSLFYTALSLRFVVSLRLAFQHDTRESTPNPGSFRRYCSQPKRIFFKCCQLTELTSRKKNEGIFLLEFFHFIYYGLIGTRFRL